MPSASKKKRQPSEAELVGDIVAAYEFVDWLKHGGRTSRERERAGSAATRLGLDRQNARSLARKR